MFASVDARDHRISCGVLYVEIPYAAAEHGGVEPTEQFAANLRRLRRTAGLSQEQLGFAADIHRTEIGFLERGDRDPQLKTIVKLARGLEVSPVALLEDID